MCCSAKHPTRTRNRPAELRTAAANPFCLCNLRQRSRRSTVSCPCHIPSVTYFSSIKRNCFWEEAMIDGLIPPMSRLILKVQRSSFQGSTIHEAVHVLLSIHYVGHWRECHGHDDGLTCVARVAERKPFPAQCEENLADRDAGSEALVGHLRNPQTASESCCKRV